MGHIHLQTLPRSQKWQDVVGLIAGGANVERIAAASADAAEHRLERASQDEGLAYAFWLLTQIPQAARQPNFQNDCGNSDCKFRAGQRFWKSVQHSPGPSIAICARPVSAATLARWRNMLRRKRFQFWRRVSCRASLGRQQRMFNKRWRSSTRRLGSVSLREISFPG